MCSTFNVKCSWDGLLEGRNCSCVWSFWCSELCSVHQTVTVLRGVCWVWGVQSDFAHSGWVQFLESGEGCTNDSLSSPDYPLGWAYLKKLYLWDGKLWSALVCVWSSLAVSVGIDSWSVFCWHCVHCAARSTGFRCAALPVFIWHSRCCTHTTCDIVRFSDGGWRIISLRVTWADFPYSPTAALLTVWLFIFTLLNIDFHVVARWQVIFSMCFN